MEEDIYLSLREKLEENDIEFLEIKEIERECIEDKYDFFIIMVFRKFNDVISNEEIEKIFESWRDDGMKIKINYVDDIIISCCYS